MEINLPEVTIWVAARNEASQLPFLLDSLIKQDYPLHLITILVGNDQSTDDTATIAKAYQAQHSFIRLIDIPDYDTHLRSKSRVLNYLAKYTSSPYVLITDADIVLPTKWVSSLVNSLTNNKLSQPPKMVSGITTMVGKSMFSLIQGLDWLTALFTIHQMDKLKIGVTALGNNMGFDFRTYQAIGGYEKLPASIVEDFQLYMAFRDAGHTTSNLYQPEVLAYTSAPETWAEYIKQRVRWFSGGMETAGPIRLVFFAQFLTYPILVLLIILNVYSSLAWWLILTRYFAVVALTYTAWFSAGRPKTNNLQYLLPFLFEFYFFVGYGATIIAFYTRKRIEWKGRTY